MEKKPHDLLRQSSLNTLAQSETDQYKDKSSQRIIIVQGNGSNLTDEKGLKGRAKRKMITQKMVYSLIDLAKKKEDADRLNSYWNTYYCQNKIYSANGKYYGRYCKNRFCTLCCSIRKADIINRYLPIISAWEEPHFVTLTVKAVKANILSQRMRKLNKGIRIITSRYRKRAQRGKGIKLVGIKALECNFNQVKRTYNPHIHLIVANKQMAEVLINEWLNLCTSKFANRAAQNMQLVRNKEKALIEIVKYGSKIFTEPDVTAKATNKSNCDIYAAALDNIFIAMKGCRIFERFGFNLPERERQTKATALSQYEEWEFNSRTFDWLQTHTEKSFTGFKPLQELVNLLEYNIDTVLE